MRSAPVFILILGVLLIWLAATGRVQAVWSALTRPAAAAK
jgi:hypothetical protein